MILGQARFLPKNSLITRLPIFCIALWGLHPMVKPISKTASFRSGAQYKRAAMQNAFGAKPRFVIIPKNVVVLNNAVNVQGKRPVYQLCRYLGVHCFSCSSSPFITRRPQNISIRYKLGNRHRRNFRFSLRTESSVSPYRDISRWGSPAVNNMNICSNVYPVFVGDLRGTTHIETAGVEIRSLLLPEGLLRIFERMFCGLGCTLRREGASVGGIGTSFNLGSLFLNLLQGVVGENGVQQRHEHTCALDDKKYPLSERLRWPITIFGAVVFMYFFSKLRFGPNWPIPVLLLGIIVGLLIFSYGINLFAKLGEYLYQ